MAQQQWYLAIGGQQVGPVGEDEVVREHPERAPSTATRSSSPPA